MRDVLLIFSGFIGGLFLGFLAALLAFFVWEIVKEGLADRMKMAAPALLLFGIFGAALAYLVGVVFDSLPVFVGAAIAFTYCSRPLFKEDESNSQ